MGDDPYEDYFKPPLGLELPASIYQPLRDVLGEASQAPAGNTVLRVGQELATGGWTQTAYLVLSPAERDRLIEKLLEHQAKAPAQS